MQLMPCVVSCLVLFLDVAILCRLITQRRDWSRMPGVLHQSRDWLTVSYNMSSATLSPSPTQLYSIHTTDCLSDTFQRESRRAIGTSLRTSLLLVLHHAECSTTQSLQVNVSHMMPVMSSSLSQQVLALENQVLGVGLVFMSCSTVISHHWTSYHIHLLNSHGTVNSRT